MNKFCLVFVLVVALAHADDEPFSIGLGVLSPSYSQTVGKENVKVNFEQKDNGFSYSVGDPKSGTNTYLNFGGAAASQPVNPSGYADANPTGYEGAGYGGANLGGYAGPSSSGYAGPSSSGYAGPSSSGYAGPSSSGYAGPSSSGYAGPSSSGYEGPSPSAYTGPASPSGFAQTNPAYSGYAGYQAPSYGASGHGASGYGSENAYGGSAGLSGLYNEQAASPVSPSGYQGGESARKPEENPAQILPAGFSYHGTDGQAFLRQRDSPNFIISDERKESARGPAEQSFLDNFMVDGPEISGKVLPNGLVGYGPGGPRGGLPVGGYAGPQFAGLVREHGGHSS